MPLCERVKTYKVGYWNTGSTSTTHGTAHLHGNVAHGDFTTHHSGSNSIPMIKRRITRTIHCFNEPKRYSNYYDARYLANSISNKYGMAQPLSSVVNQKYLVGEWDLIFGNETIEFFKDGTLKSIVKGELHGTGTYSFNGKNHLQLVVNFINPESTVSITFTVLTLVHDRLSLVSKPNGEFLEYMKAK